MRNFRQNYYSSLGVQFVESKSTLENALQGDILDIDKLNKVCLWIRIPHMYRPTVWKILLGVLPLSKQAWTIIDDLNNDSFQELFLFLKSILGVDLTINKLGGKADLHVATMDYGINYSSAINAINSLLENDSNLIANKSNKYNNNVLKYTNDTNKNVGNNVMKSPLTASLFNSNITNALSLAATNISLLNKNSKSNVYNDDQYADPNISDDDDDITDNNLMDVNNKDDDYNYGSNSIKKSKEFISLTPESLVILALPLISNNYLSNNQNQNYNQNNTQNFNVNNTLDNNIGIDDNLINLDNSENSNKQYIKSSLLKDKAKKKLFNNSNNISSSSIINNENDKIIENSKNEDEKNDKNYSSIYEHNRNIDENLLIHNISPMELLNLIQLYSQNLDNKNYKFIPDHLVSIASSIIDICIDQKESDSLMIFTYIILKFKIPIRKEDINNFGEEHILLMKQLLYIHDNYLYRYIENTIFQGDKSKWIHVFQYWFLTLFSSCLTTQILESIWDIYFGGANSMLSYLGLSILLEASKIIMTITKYEDLLKFIKSDYYKYGDIDFIGNNAINLWERPLLDKMTLQQKRLLNIV